VAKTYQDITRHKQRVNVIICPGRTDTRFYFQSGSDKNWRDYVLIPETVCRV